MIYSQLVGDQIPKTNPDLDPRPETPSRDDAAGQGLTVGEQIRFSADLRNPKDTGSLPLAVAGINL